MLNLTVVRMESADLSDAELDDAAIGAYAACVARELVDLRGQ
jgi:hypothetical protein